MKGLSSESVKLEGSHISADFVKDPASVAEKKDTRFTLRYKDGKIVLPSGLEKNEEEEEREEMEEEEEEVGDDSGSGEEESESDSFGLDLNSEDEQEEEEDNSMDSRDGTSSNNDDSIKKAAAKELPYTFTGALL